MEEAVEIPSQFRGLLLINLCFSILSHHPAKISGTIESIIIKTAGTEVGIATGETML